MKEAFFAFSRHVGDYYKRAFSFKHHTSIEGLWIGLLYYFLTSVIFFALLEELGVPKPYIPFSSFPTWLFETWIFIHIIPTFTIMIRRLNDCGQPWWRILTILIPYVGIFVFMFFLNQPTAVKIRQVS